jgi:hypothetical protein
MRRLNWPSVIHVWPQVGYHVRILRLRRVGYDLSGDSILRAVVPDVELRLCLRSRELASASSAREQAYKEVVVVRHRLACRWKRLLLI